MYISKYHEKEGIRLDPDKIIVTKAVRSFSKQLLNSIMGRFRMRSNFSSCKLITYPARFTQLKFSGHCDVTQFCVDMGQCFHADGRESRGKDIYVFIGTLTTAYISLMLYNLLHMLSMVYCILTQTM